jgi:hypothetical protein
MRPRFLRSIWRHVRLVLVAAVVYAAMDQLDGLSLSRLPGALLDGTGYGIVIAVAIFLVDQGGENTEPTYGYGPPGTPHDEGRKNA